MRSAAGGCIAFLLGAALVLGPGQVGAAESVTVREVRHQADAGHFRVVVDLSGATRYVHHRLKNPDRLFLDFERSSVAGGVEPSKEFSHGVVKGVRVSQYRSDTVRVVLDLADVDRYKISRLGHPERVVVDVYGSETNFSARRVVIDAGHGGKDPGAVARGLQEKDVVLDLALKVKRILERQGGYEVLLTRTDDRYLSLEERTRFANARRADLFVSIHLNASRNAATRGVETYLLNWTDNAEALKVAARENKISVRKMRQAGSELGVILASLERQNKRDESLKLAHLVQGSMLRAMESRFGGVVDLGVKQALFYVLLGAEMPSILVEASFMTHHREAGRLKSPVYRDLIARGIAAGVTSYFATTGPVQQVARR